MKHSVPRIRSGWFALVACFFLGLNASAEPAKLPERTTELLEKLKTFISEKTLERDTKIETAEESALTILAEHQEKETKQGKLDSVLALRKIKKLEKDIEIDPIIPNESKAVIKKYFRYREARDSQLEKEIAEKQKAVIRLLEKQVIDETKNGSVDMAVAVRAEIGKLKVDTLKYQQRDLVDALLSYTWGWHKQGSAIRLKFNENGGVWHLGMHGNWSVVGERQILISPADGHRKVLMEFKDDLSSWSEANDGEYGGIRREPRKPKK